MASSTVILVLLITCCEPFAWFDSLVCPFSSFKCNWPNNVSQKCSKLYRVIWIQRLHEKTYSVVLHLARLRSMTEESGSKEATKLSQKESRLTSKLMNEIFNDTPRILCLWPFCYFCFDAVSFIYLFEFRSIYIYKSIEQGTGEPGMKAGLCWSLVDASQFCSCHMLPSQGLTCQGGDGFSSCPGGTQ